MGLDKKKLAKQFQKDWKKHYKVKFLEQSGFKRIKCQSCGKHFWSLDSDRKTCADSSCVGFEFIGQKGKNLGYTETWEKIEKYFTNKGHKSITRYPTVCRWRDDLYFTNASIIDFQPYVVSGEIEPPANPLIVPQPSIRFSDIENVGVTGQHYSSFIMFGQHAFNSKKTGLFYWKDEALEHDFNYLTKVLGVKKEDITFIEDVWMGGGTFGPSIEYAAKGVELGNCVFMQFKDLGKGKFEELPTKVIDMGAGLERLAWYTNGSPTSYEITFGPVVQKMKKNAGIKIDNKLFTEFSKLSGALDVETHNVKEKREKIAKQLKVDEEEFFGTLKPLQAVYASADHLKTLLYTVGDGQMPSNGSGGYNLRMLLRRVFGFNEEFDLRLDFIQVLREHADYLKDFDPILKENVETVVQVIEEEEKKFEETKLKGARKIETIVKKNKKIDSKELIKLYESDGISPELIEEKAQEAGVKINIPENFYGLIAAKNEKDKKLIKHEIDVRPYKKTKTLFYEDSYLRECNATVLGVIDKGIILDQTVFYAEGGGQESDEGFIDGIKVEFVENVDGVLIHFVENPDKFKRGKKVFCEIDWNRRIDLMRHHTGAHLLNAAARQVLGKHVWQTGAHKAREKAHLDITHYKRITGKELKQMELLANQFALEQHEVETMFMLRNEAEKKYGFRLYQGGFVPGKTIRIVNVKSVDVEACGGTHLKNSSEVGLFKILKREGIQDGVERIVYVCGLPAIKEMQKKESLLKDAAEKLSVPEKSLTKTTQRFFNEWKEQKKTIESLEKELIELKTAELLKMDEEIITTYVHGLTAQGLMNLAKKVLNEKENSLLIIGSGENVFALSGKKCSKNAKKELALLLQETKWQGGGNEKLARGKVQNAKELEKLL